MDPLAATGELAETEIGEITVMFTTAEVAEWPAAMATALNE